MHYDQPNLLENLPTQPASIRWNLIGWAIFLGLGAFGYIYISNALSHDMFAFIEFIATFPTGFFILLSPTSKERNLLRRWLGWVIAFVFSLLMFVSVTKSYLDVIRQLTPDLIHQFGARSVIFFAGIFAWAILTPPKHTNVKLRKLRVAIAVAVGLLQALLVIRFLPGIWAANSIDQVRSAVRLLLYIGLASYLLVLVRVFLPGVAYRQGVVRAEGS